MARELRAMISGIGRIPVARDLARPILDAYRRTAAEAVKDAGIGFADVDGLFVVPPISAEPWMMFAANLAEHLGLETRRLGGYENGGCSSLLALSAAIDAVEARECRAALVIAGDTRPAMDLEHFEVFVHKAVFKQTSLYGPASSLYGVGAPIPFYAMSHQRYLHEHGARAEDVAGVAVRLRAHAARSPFAQFRDPITVEDVMASKVFSPPIHLFEAASVSSGVSAVVVTDGRARISPARSIRILGRGEHHTPSHFVAPHKPLTSFEAVARAASSAYSEAGLRPSDIDVAEVYGVFAATELIAYEDLGFFAAGTAWRAVAEGRTTFGSGRVLNPSGGRIAFGHPAGATPMYEVAEIVAQLRHEAGESQVGGAEVGLVQAEHGMMNGATVMIMGNA